MEGGTHGLEVLFGDRHCCGMGSCLLFGMPGSEAEGCGV